MEIQASSIQTITTVRSEDDHWLGTPDQFRGMSTYSYGEGAPLVFSDPLGLQGRGMGWGQRIGAMIARPIVLLL